MDLSAVSKLITDLTSAISGLAIPVGILSAVICGIMWIFSSDQQTVSKAKSWLIRIVIGLLIVGLADTVVHQIADSAGVSESGTAEKAN